MAVRSEDLTEGLGSQRLLRLLQDSHIHRLILGAIAELPFLKAIFHLALPQLIKRARELHFGWMNEILEQ